MGKKIAKGNSASGKITAIGKGNTYVTCTIITDKQAIVLKCNIYVD